jgi:signal transduction histidine kinase
VIQVPAVDLGLAVTNMTKPKNQLFCRLDGLTPLARQEQRSNVVQELDLLSSEAAPVFEETTQKAVTFSGAPISILGLVVENELWFKSAVGLSTIGLTTPLAAQRKISLAESFSTFVIDSQQPLVIENALTDRVFANSILTQHYGIKAYLGVPLISLSGVCIGTLSVMSWTERKFDDRDIDYLTLLCRWCLNEFERSRTQRLDRTSPLIERSPWPTNSLVLPSVNNSSPSTEIVHSKSNYQPKPEKIVNTATDSIKLKLLSQLTQELRTPLTSVIGMASVLHREVYGPLTLKQREYLEIIHNSGQNLIALVDEIVSLGILNARSSKIDLAAVDVEMLCQQVINSLSDIAQQYQQDLRLSVEPGDRIWSLDKEKVRQALYYLIMSILEKSEPGAEIKIHVSRRDRILNIAVGAYHAWLGDDFSQAKPQSQAIAKALSFNHSGGSVGLSGKENAMASPPQLPALMQHSGERLTASSLMMAIEQEKTLNENTNKIPRDVLGLLFCCHLTELHQGIVIVRGSNSNYRYLLQFPKAKSEEI